MRRLVAIGTALATSFGASAALAQPNTGTTTIGPPEAASSSAATDHVLAEARAAFREGTLLAKQSRWVDALEAFERSEALHPHAITVYNIGYCERRLGHFTRARKMLNKALADHETRGEVELPPDLVSATQAFLTEADRQIASVLVTVTPEGGAVGVDGRPLELATTEGHRPVLIAGTRTAGPAEVPPTSPFEVELDPGSHVFVLVSKGRPDVVASETLSPGSHVMIELRAPASEAAGVSKDVESASEAISVGTPNRVPALIALGVGAAGLVAGTVSGLIAFGKKGAVSEACGTNGDSASCNAQLDAGNRAADISTIAFIAGGVGVAVGAILYFTASTGGSTKSAPAASSTFDVQPWVGWQNAGMRGTF